ncbi:16S rRNA (adenine(1518)-N(6)/adenine(1519)-N(6))-dimethyltransferase RsmA [Mycoplasma sp. 744]|uniref:16S rRNA (adenine(1518)-N(6)/adenine(1519)-N(6))- dimethyltransferase RsmA n=1 Tax=Mycoplasma sp. 744 TaxID=3108531 RepID=UPI002B1D40E1|nr:16S rRNA (adenine(1518)-N(6)/adenine(1519)-N(6))-dimethyltransferase RsmA [Mycoplasma sp. 744]MEA4115349.1 16S rRNA (adenine(1518)-N(6)/adenine(1519)-N(6))-dimethyltransferase RsmA [Mycoplasma sp. 744]
MFLEKNNIQAKKKFGQNFLIDKKIIQRIIDLVESKNKKILEIGPGLGALSKFLVKECTEFKAFEIDNQMIDYLLTNQILQEKHLIKGDFLKIDLTPFNDYEIVGNIPYNITSEILLKIFEYRHLFKRAIIMMQKEVADRLVAKHNTINYSKLTITAQYVANIKKHFLINKNAFNPSPKVDSAIVEFKFKQIKNDNYETLKDFFKLCFFARRKKLNYSLKQKYKENTIQKAFQELKLNSNVRIQQLDLDLILKLFSLLEKYKED